MKDIASAFRRARKVDTREAAARAGADFVDRAEAAGLLDVAYAVVGSPLGLLTVAATRRGLVQISYGGDSLDDALERLARRVSPRILESPARLDDVRRQLDDYFDGRRKRFELTIDLTGVSGFPRRVLRATARIPYGRVRSYREVAEKTGSPRAMRAAGNALGANPIPIVVPCHRVVRSDGTLGGYTGGLHRKEFLLDLEHRYLD